MKKLVFIFAIFLISCTKLPSPDPLPDRACLSCENGIDTCGSVNEMNNYLLLMKQQGVECKQIEP